MPGNRGVEADLGLVEPETVLAELEIFFRRQRSPAARISRVSESGWPSGT
jgi:hypothetical protein